MRGHAAPVELARPIKSPGGPFHAVAEEESPFREIAAVIGRRLNVPVVSKTKDEAAAHFGWFATFAGNGGRHGACRLERGRGHFWAGSRNSPDSSPISTIRAILRR